MGVLLIYAIIIPWISLGTVVGKDGTACESQIWCTGDLLHTFQTSGLFDDSKTFVDMNLKADQEIVLNAFRNVTQRGSPNKTSLQLFLDQYFEGPGMELEQWTPSDYKENPGFLADINDSTLRKFGKDMCRIWSHLGRKIKGQVKIHEERYSIIYLENPFIVPGGRFREIYYWDSYWVVKGLLVCEMHDTVKGILENFVSLIKRYGLVPNGGRLYYTNRSQPPLLLPMVHLYVKRTNNTHFVEENMQYLIQEYEFWSNNRSVQVPGKQFSLYRYNVDTSIPRPESYTEDINTNRMKERLKVHDDDLFSDLASAAESGWDFSSRWFSQDYDSNTNKTQWLSYTKTTDILPVDLNSILCWNEGILAELHQLTGNTTGEEHFQSLHNQTRTYIQETLWHKEDEIWYDYSISDRTLHRKFYPSNIFPMVVGCYDSTEKSYLDTQILQYLKQSGMLDYISGVSTSDILTGQQWDFPNAWPPLQDLVITALENSELKESRELAFNLTTKWITSNLVGYQKYGAMFEKYVVNIQGSRGSGGEYNVQEGFGWTNGVVLDLLDRYGQNLTSALHQQSTTGSSSSTIHVSLALWLISVFCYIFLSELLTLYQTSKFQPCPN